MSYSDFSDPYRFYRDRAEPLGSAIATVVAAILLTTLLISFQPFAASERISEAPTGPNSLNQIGFSALGLLAVCGMAMIADRRRLVGVLDAAWLPIIACLLLSAANTADPAGATRSVLFTLIVVVTCAGVLVIPHSPMGFRQATSTAVIIVLAVSYIGIFLLPGSAIHGAGGSEAQHEGLWRGVFSHKNVAGPVMATFLFFGIYLMRAGDRWKGFVILILILSAVFILQTGSKTTNGMIPLAIGAVFAGRCLPHAGSPPALVVASVIFAALFTVGTVVWPMFGEMVANYLSDPTYTGGRRFGHLVWRISQADPGPAMGSTISGSNPWSRMLSAHRCRLGLSGYRQWAQQLYRHGPVHGHSGCSDCNLCAVCPSAR